MEAAGKAMDDDEALLRATDAEWLLVPLCAGGVACGESAPTTRTLERTRFG
jgi:hypothetical protein